MKSMANPAPLGLFGFALTTFVLSCFNAGIFGVHATDPINVVVGLAFFYGGIAQALAGMWEFCHGDTFAATAFSSYGAFWLSYSSLSIPWFGVNDGYLHAGPSVVSHAIATYLLGWTIFTFVMLVASVRTSIALCVLFCFVELTFILLTIAEFGGYQKVHRAGGFVGIITSFIAWYAALAVLLESQEKPLFSLPMGKRDGGAKGEEEK